ncbi:MAG: efflux RND transporter periplasmic adaptor subunit, partial [Planctomycetaceae bacterium]|nr:efflux RND transporter periplasmic adaptor subunit [Planctomycetaceae bacterium]
FNRVQELVASRSVEGRLLDEARKRLDSAKASKASAESAVVSAEAAVRVAQAKSTAAKALQTTAIAETNVARKQLEEVDELIKYATLTAPFAGVVTERNVDLGDLVRNTQSGAGGAPLFTVAQVDTVRVRVSLPEGDAPWCQAGDRVALQFKSLGGTSIEGQVARVAKSLESSTRTMLAEIDLPNSDGRLLPGMYGEATIFLEEHADVLTLPASAVRYNETGKAFLYVVGASNAIQIVDITTGLDDGKLIEITGGLDAQTRVVDAMIGRLQPGQKVQIAGK